MTIREVAEAAWKEEKESQLEQQMAHKQDIERKIQQLIEEGVAELEKISRISIKSVQRVTSACSDSQIESEVQAFITVDDDLEFMIQRHSTGEVQIFVLNKKSGNTIYSPFEKSLVKLGELIEKNENSGGR